MRPPRLVLSALSVVALGGCLCLADPALGASATTYYGTDRSGNLVSVAVTGNRAGPPTVLHDANPETEQLSAGDSDAGVVVGFVADIDAGTTTLFTYDTTTKQFHHLGALGHHIGAAAIYEHGTRIAYSRRTKHGYVIRSVPTAGGAPATLFESPSWNPWDIAVSENGKHVYFSARQAVSIAGQPDSDTHRSNVFRVTAHGKKRLEKDVADPLSYTQISLSPDDSKLAVVRQRLTGSPRSRFTVVNLTTGHVRTVMKSYANPIAGLAWAGDGSSLVFRDLTGWARLGLHGRLDAIAKTSKLAAPVLAS